MFKWRSRFSVRIQNVTIFFKLWGCNWSWLKISILSTGAVQLAKNEIDRVNQTTKMNRKKVTPLVVFYMSTKEREILSYPWRMDGWVSDIFLNFLSLWILFPGETVAAIGRIINRHLSEQSWPEIQVSSSIFLLN